MKAAWNREQSTWVAGSVLAVLAAGGWAWLGLGRLAETQAEIENLKAQTANPSLGALLADSGNLSRARQDALELGKLEKELRQEDGKEGEAWATATRLLAGEGQEWSKDPGKWKDRLITVQNDLRQASDEKRVRLAPDFYLGLEAYREKSPTPEEVPALALQLSVAQLLVETIFRARQAALEQYPTECEILELSGPASLRKGAGPAGEPSPLGKKAAPALPGPERIRFRLRFRSSPEVLYRFVRLLEEDPENSALWVVADLGVTNEKQSFPLRSEIAKAFSSPSPTEEKNPDQEQSKKKLLEILAGKESLAVAMEIDFVAWRSPGEGGSSRSVPTAKP